METYWTLNAERCSIRCKLYADDLPDIRTLILFGHGFGGHKDNRAAEKFARHVLKKNSGLAVMTFDWPCHGEDVRRTLRLEDCDRYLRLVLSHVRENFGAPALYAYATSFGGYLFLKYSSEHGDPFVKTALRCPAVNMYEVITKAIMTGEAREQLRRGKPALVGFDRKIEIDWTFLESLQQADISRRAYASAAEHILILQGTEDEIVPFEAVRTFAERNGIAFVPVEGADHRFLRSGTLELAHAQILSFFGLK